MKRLVYLDDELLITYTYTSIRMSDSSGIYPSTILLLYLRKTMIPIISMVGTEVMEFVALTFMVYACDYNVKCSVVV